MVPLGVRTYGLGAMALGLVGLAWGDFALQWQPVEAGLPGRTPLAYVFAALLLIAGAAVNWRAARPSLDGQAADVQALNARASDAQVHTLQTLGIQALIVLYAIVVLLMHGPTLVQHPGAFPAWNGAAEQLTLVAGGLAAYTRVASMPGPRRAQLVHVAALALAVCLLTFGTAHFLYLQFTASMVPAWLPGGRTFWAAFTGVAHIAAGIALLSGFQSRRAAILLTAMFATFSILVHLPLLLADPHSHLNWVMNAINLALTGAAGSVAGALPLNGPAGSRRSH